jgi:PAS domain S-box-containing protein
MEKKQTNCCDTMESTSLRAIIESSPVMIFQWRFSESFPVTFVSENVSQLGYSAEDFLSGKVSWTGITHPDDESRLRTELELNLAERKDEFSQTYRLRTASGEYRWMEDWNRFIRNAAGDLTHINAVIVDITERKGMEEALWESETNFRALAENAQAAIVIETEDGRNLFSNDRVFDLTGFSAEQVRNKAAIELIHPDDRAMVRTYTQQRLRGETVPEVYETRLDSVDGRNILVEISGSRTTWQGKPATLGILRDITRQRAVENERERAHAMLEQAERIAQAGCWEYNIEKDHLFMSPNLRELFDVAPEPAVLTHESIQERIHPHDYEQLTRKSTEAMARSEGFSHEYRIIDREGNVRDVLSRAAHAHGENGKQGRLIGMTMDVTERRRLERDILEIARREQQRLGQDLHDTLGQELAGLSFMAKALEKSLRAQQSDSADEAAQLSELAQQSVKQCRRIAHGLVPIDVPAESFALELRALCIGMSELYSTPCECSITNAAMVFDNKSASHLYRIATEAIVNAMRHANPITILVTLQTCNGNGTLCIKDDGEWKPSKPNDGGGVGLRIMQHRAELIDAGLVVRHAPEEGTTVTCTFPNKPTVEDSGIAKD